MLETTHVGESQPQVKDYDFRRQDELPPADIEDFSAIQRTFCERFAAELSGYLRREFSIKLGDVRQLSWNSYARGLTDPSCFLLLRSRAIGSYGVLELGPSFVFSILEFLLGGTTDSPAGVARELTAIEKKLLRGVFNAAQARLREAWSANGPDFEMESVISSPAAATGIPAGEPMVVTEFLVTVDGISGHMCLAVPATFVRQHRPDPDTMAVSVPNSCPPEGSGTILKLIQKGAVRADTRLSGATIRVRDLVALERDDVLNLGRPVSAPLTMSINGVEIYTGFIAPAHGKRSFAIQSVNREKPSPSF
jgi:flagellar motor switch protein FliM